MTELRGFDQSSVSGRGFIPVRVQWLGKKYHGPLAAGEAEVAKWELSNVGEIAQSTSSPARLLFDCLMHESAADQGSREEGKRVCELSGGERRLFNGGKGEQNYVEGVNE